MRKTIYLLLFLAGIMQAFDAKPSTCTKRFQIASKDHALCRKKSRKLIKSGIPSGKDRKLIMNCHNRGRSAVQPEAADMQKMYWDDELAQIMHGYLMTCGRGHDKNHQRVSPGKYSVGQNLAYGTYKYGWWSIVKAWYMEVKDFTYGNKAKNKFRKIGHYTQVVWAKTSRVGCAWAKCKGQWPVYGCNYAVAGNLHGHLHKPYKRGKPCSACPGKCSGKLCDCGGKACYNRGSMDLKTCSCRCRTFYNDAAYVAKKNCAIDCYKSHDYKKKANKWTCKRVVKKMSFCKNMFYRYACPWICGLCPYAGLANGKLPATKSSRKTNSKKKSRGNKKKSSWKSRPCPEVFKKWYKKHTMCSAKSRRLERSGIPKGKDRKLIIDLHNKVRGMVKPTAANMQRMYWDDELATVALRRASTCPGPGQWERHNEREIPGKYPVGQNVAFGKFRANWWGVIRAWYMEVKNFRYGNKKLMKRQKKSYRHYTQLVWDSSARVGCAWSKCKGHPKMYICNYGRTGNIYTRFDKPYKEGRSCSMCKGRCKKKLCDCGGKVCLNWGRLDVNTCRCRCRRYTDPKKDCAINCNKAADYKRRWKKSRACRDLINKHKKNLKAKCWTGYSIACPWMCEVCPYINKYQPVTKPKSVKQKKPSRRPSGKKLKTKKIKQKMTSPGGKKTNVGGRSKNVKKSGKGKPSVSTTQPVSTTSKSQGKSKPRPCDFYKIWHARHSMCLKPSKKYLKSSAIPTGKERNLIVDTHNRARSFVNPPAANMQKMYWDDELAAVAKHWVSTCPGLKHDGNSQRYIPGKYRVGQNMAAGYFKYGWWSVIKLWYDEVKDHVYGDKAKMMANARKVGHYTQVVWAATSRVGCAWAECSNTRYKKIYVCNYAPAGNMNGQYHEPYKRSSSSSCSDCPGKCQKSLCDCGGKTCFNRGTLNPNTCSCKCFGFQNTGTYRPNNNCAADCTKSKDYKMNVNGSFLCVQYVNTAALRKQNCRKGTFFALACPWMCRLCPKIDYRKL